MKLLGEVSGAVAIGAESVTGIAKGAIQWLQVASKLPVDKDADDLVARRLTELTNSLGSRPIRELTRASCGSRRPVATGLRRRRPHQGD